MMDVSVIVPVYNSEEHIARCLDSLLDQREAPVYEVICIDDASTDGSAAILKRYTMQHPHIIRLLANKENLGNGPSKDRGVQAAQGDYLMFIDSDDYVKADYIERFHKATQDTPCDIIIGGFIQTDGQKESTQLLPDSNWTLLGFSAPWGKIFRTSFVKENGLEFSDYRLGEDMFFILNAFAANASCRIIDYAGYYYFENPGSITREKDHDRQLEQVMSTMYARFLESSAYMSLDESKRQMVEYSYIADMLSTILLFSKGCGAERMEQKHAFFMKDLRAKFPHYRNNPHLGFLKPRGQRLKTRIGVGAFNALDRLGLSKQLFLLFS